MNYVLYYPHTGTNSYGSSECSMTTAQELTVFICLESQLPTHDSSISHGPEVFTDYTPSSVHLHLHSPTAVVPLILTDQPHFSTSIPVNR